MLIWWCSGGIFGAACLSMRQFDWLMRDFLLAMRHFSASMSQFHRSMRHSCFPMLDFTYFVNIKTKKTPHHI